MKTSNTAMAAASRRASATISSASRRASMTPCWMILRGGRRRAPGAAPLSTFAARGPPGAFAVFE
ncbi:MAG: hypothetical protein AAFX50_20025, partial [Acidobacteriota bacterium]